MYKIIYSCVIYAISIKAVDLLDISNLTRTIANDQEPISQTKHQIIFIENNHDTLYTHTEDDLHNDPWEDHLNVVYLKKKSLKTDGSVVNYDEYLWPYEKIENDSVETKSNIENLNRRQLIKRDAKKESYKGYGRWTKWTLCSRNCRTKRIRKCKKPSICGSAPIIRQSAYCFIEGTSCEKFISKKLNLSKRNKGTENPSDVLAKVENQCGIPLDYGRKNHLDRNNNDISYLRNGKSYNDNHKKKHSNNYSNHRDMWFLLRIIGGRPARSGKWPWQVLLVNKNKEPFCGGTLIAPRWILTAAHCVRRRLYVRIREHDLSKREGPEMEFKIKDSFLHPSYDPDTVDNDIALLRLPTTLDHNVGYACLPDTRFGQKISGNLGSIMCAITGWGKSNINHSKGTNVLHEAQISIISDRECHKAYNEYYITRNMFCGGTRGGTRDSCAGDSGGPLVCKGSDGRWFIYGITSFGEGCGRKGKFGIYSRVPNYIDWINQIIDRYN